MRIEDLLAILAKQLGIPKEEVSEALKGSLKSPFPYSIYPQEVLQLVYTELLEERGKVVGKKVLISHHLSEEDGALFLNRNLSTLKRGRESGLLIPGKHYVDLGERGIRYLALQLCNMWIFGVRGIPWDDIPDDPISSAPTTSPKGTGPQGGIAPGTMEKSDALRSARRILKRPKPDLKSGT